MFGGGLVSQRGRWWFEFKRHCLRLWGCTASQCQFIVLFCLTWLMWYSVLFWSLQGCCLILIMCRCCTCCLYSIIGMDSPSYIFTQMTLLKFLRGWWRTLVIVFVAFPQMLVLALWPRSYCMKPKLNDDAKGSKIQADLANLKTLHHMLVSYPYFSQLQLQSNLGPPDLSLGIDATPDLVRPSPAL